MRLENEGQGVKIIKKERQEQLKNKARLKYAEIMKEQQTKQEKEQSQLKETMRLEAEKHEEQWERKQKLYEFEINQLEGRAKFESTEIEKLREENEELRKFREEERLKRRQEVEQYNNVGRVTSPQGGTLVVRDLIDIARRMKQRLGQALIKETQIKMETREVTKTKKEVEVLSETREIDRVENKLNGTKEETETRIQEETNRHEETIEIEYIETWEIEKIEERLHDKDGVKGTENTHT
uniref:Uncharacterized protein n=1 Tax=Eptatretus burgeri TaxID=7764 RepID=A0A8C4NFS6_EPTBU